MVNSNKRAVNILYQDISRLSDLNYENEMKLNRLRKAKNNIENDREDLFQYQRDLYKPDFSSFTWAGKHAAIHLNIIDSTVQSYKQIANYQVDVILDAIEWKIRKLESENYHLMSSIGTKRKEIIRLQNQ
ncbi:YwqH-like family protein [Bacillus marasmi]|uniref:YwqH-like family protein n=1 Tax=Bacillus marasmi TaxID=1926279 RepID=UPI0011C9D12F|nr:DUF5082 family protein [Bacillus marasmi]